jgi:hypothetical protein
MLLTVAVHTASFLGTIDQNMPVYQDSQFLDICMRFETFSLARDTLSFSKKCLLKSFRNAY